MDQHFPDTDLRETSTGNDMVPWAVAGRYSGERLGDC